MEKRTSAPARIAAALALVAAVLIVVVVVGAAMNDDSSPHQQRTERPAKKQKQKQRSKAKTYTIESGDTLTAIAQKTDVPVAELIRLNPGVDPQILTAGETLKLR